MHGRIVYRDTTLANIRQLEVHSSRTYLSPFTKDNRDCISQRVLPNFSTSSEVTPLLVRACAQQQPE